MQNRSHELNEQELEQLRSRLANGTVKPEAREEMDRFELLSRAADQESQGHTWE